jgi:hypothetical protein
MQPRVASLDATCRDSDGDISDAVVCIVWDRHDDLGIRREIDDRYSCGARFADPHRLPSVLSPSQTQIAYPNVMRFGSWKSRRR